MVTLDALRLPEAMLTVAGRYLDRLNFATNFAFFRDEGGLSTRLVTANYWSGYGATAVRLWLRLFAADGSVLATWEQAVPSPGAGIAIDSRAVRARFALPAVHRPAFHPCDRRGRARRGEIRARHFCAADGPQPVLHA